MVLPNGYEQMTPAEQLLVLANLERGDRGLSLFAGLSPSLSSASQQAAANGTDPEPPSGYPWDQWGSNWADSVTALEADFLWMYDDGVGGTNYDCENGNFSGCWGHRNNILGPWTTVGNQYATMGAYGEAATFAEIFVNRLGSPDSLVDPYSSVSYPAEVVPQVVQVGPWVAPSPGTGTAVTIEGNYFSAFSNGQVPTVYFGSSPATNVHVNWDGQLTADAPANPDGGAANTVVVTVVTPAGTSSSTPNPDTNEFTYTAAPVPTVTGVSPNVGSNAGGQTVTVTGTNFTWTTSVDFGSVPASAFTINSATSITATVPASANTGTTDVIVNTSEGGASATSSLDQYTYKLSSTTTASVSTSNPAQGSAVTYSANVTSNADTNAGPPSGTVTFSVGWTLLCTTSALSNGTASCQATNAPPGSDNVLATYSGDSNYISSTGSTSLLVTSGTYTPLNPTRVCDTRSGNLSGLSGPALQCNGAGNGGSTIAAGGTKVINVAGDFGVPSNATAVVLNVTAVSPAAPGYLTVFPTGSPKPVASNVNFVAGQVVPNLVQVGMGTNGDISIYASSRTDIIVDVEGYVSPSSANSDGAGLYNPLSAPARICDTRAGNPSSLTGGDAQCNGVQNAGTRLAAGGTMTVQVGGNNGVPANASAAVLNVTVVNPSAGGYLTAYTQGANQPTASNANFTPGETVTNRVIVPLSSGDTPGQISLFSSVSADLIIDVSGYFSPAGGSGSQFTSEVAPVRICDSRAGNPSSLTGSNAQCDGRALGTSSTLTLQVSGLAGIPSGATAVVVNLTGVTPSNNTFLTVFPGPTKPTTSDLNPAAGAVRANLAVATISPNGTITIYNNTGSINVVVDVLGWYS